MSRKQKFLWFLAGTALTALFLTPIFLPDYNQYAAEVIERYPALAPLVIIIFRFLGIVLAPLPGAPVAFASIAFLPWQEAWFYNLIGVTLGSFAAFGIARKWREPIAAKFAPIQNLHAWQEKISERRQFWGFVALRTVVGVVVDFLSYAAGLSKISFKNFAIANIAVDGIISIPFYYLGSVALAYSIYFTAGSIVLFGIIFLVFQRRWR
jgi:uncharacterized membrane protein YdjX (TVP38/TMEM64 family)